MPMKSSGFDGIETELNKIKDDFDRVMDKYNGESVGFDQIFNEEFMREHTSFDDFDSWISAGGFEFASQEEFDAIDEQKLDNYVSESTDFDTWQDMLGEAGTSLLTSELGW